jgi:hypothetical protein
LHLGGSTSIRSAYSVAKGSLLRVIWIIFVSFVLPFAVSVVVGLMAVGFSARFLQTAGLLDATDTLGIWVRVLVIFGVFLAAPLLVLRWWLAWSLAVPVTVLEGGRLRATVRRSRFLTSGRRSRIFVIYLLIILLTYAVQILFQTPYYILVGDLGLSLSTHSGALRIMASAVGAFLGTSFVGPLLEIAFTLIYYDERVRKEGFDLQWMMTSLEGGASKTATVPAS